MAKRVSLLSAIPVSYTHLDVYKRQLKIPTDGLDDVFLPLAVYRLILSEQRGLTSHVSRLTGQMCIRDSSWTLENLLYYNKTFNKIHSVGLTLMQSAEYSRSEGLEAVSYTHLLLEK